MAPPGVFYDPLEGNDTYELVKVLNRGTFGVVAMAKHKRTDEIVALKFIERGPQTMSRYVEREIVNHMRLHHPHVVELHGAFLTQDHLVLILEFAAGGDLFSLVQQTGGLPEGEARWYFQQIVVAIDYCHKLGVCNRDIKLENTLLDGSPRPLVKLCDFGFSKDASHHSAPGSKVGTPAYLAPEVITADNTSKYEGAAADVWSCGVLLYVMVCGYYPFRRETDDLMKPTHNFNVLTQRILNAEYRFPAGTSARALTAEFKDLIQRMLVADPAQRATLGEVMEHPWYTTDLFPGVLAFNDSLVERTKAEPVSPQMLAEIADLVKEAVRPGRRAAGGGSGGGGTGRESSYSADVDELLQKGFSDA